MGLSTENFEYAFPKCVHLLIFTTFSAVFEGELWCPLML